MQFADVVHRAMLSVSGYRYMIIVVKELPDLRVLAIFDYESGRIVAEAEWTGTTYHVFHPADDRPIYQGHDVEQAIQMVITSERRR